MMAPNGVNCSQVSAPVYLSFLTATVSVVLFLITVPGNLLVCLAVYKDPLKKLRKPFNLFVFNLACADLVVGFVVDPTSVVIHLREGLKDGALDGVQVIHLAYFVSCTASLLSLAALTVDRYLAVARPHFYRATLSTTHVAYVSVAIWFVSAALPCVLYFHVGYVQYAFVFVNSAVFLTLIILLLSYVQIYRRVHQQFLTADLQLHGGMNELSRQRRNAKHEARVTKAFLLVLLAFLVCYVPSCVMVYLMNLCVRCSCHTIHWLRDMQFLLVSLNSGLNPFLYSWRLPNFRRAFTIILRIRPNGRSSSGHVSVVSGSSAGNEVISLTNVCAMAALSAVSAPMKVVIPRVHSAHSQMQATSCDEFRSEKTTEETMIGEFEVFKSGKPETEERTNANRKRASFQTKTSPYGSEDIDFGRGRESASRGESLAQISGPGVPAGDANEGELGTSCVGNQAKPRHKQRASSVYARRSTAGQHKRVFSRSTSVV